MYWTSLSFKSSKSNSKRLDGDRIQFVFPSHLSLLHRFLQAQVTRSYPGDWVELVRKDIEYLNIDLSFEEIKEKSKKKKWKYLLTIRLKGKPSNI